jgi:hypothetical protein
MGDFSFEMHALVLETGHSNQEPLRTTAEIARQKGGKQARNASFGARNILLDLSGAESQERQIVENDGFGSGAKELLTKRRF